MDVELTNVTYMTEVFGVRSMSISKCMFLILSFPPLFVPLCVWSRAYEHLLPQRERESGGGRGRDIQSEIPTIIQSLYFFLVFFVT